MYLNRYWFVEDRQTYQNILSKTKQKADTHCDYKSKNHKDKSEPDFHLGEGWVISFPLKKKRCQNINQNLCE